jgi:hypothetical protein
MQRAITMDVRIRVCQVCHSKRVAAARLAEKARSSLGIVAPLEGGYHGQFALVIDGELISAPRNSLGHGMPTDELEGFLFTELEKRAGARQSVIAPV